MDKKNANFRDLPIDQAMKIANSEAGKQLIAQLQQQNGDLTQIAMVQMAAGDLDGAKQTMSRILSNPETVQLLKKLKE